MKITIKEPPRRAMQTWFTNQEIQKLAERVKELEATIETLKADFHRGKRTVEDYSKKKLW